MKQVRNAERQEGIRDLCSVYPPTNNVTLLRATAFEAYLCLSPRNASSIEIGMASRLIRHVHWVNAHTSMHTLKIVDHDW